MNFEKVIQKNWQNKYVDFIFIFCFILTGLVLRYSGIIAQHSFWSDEAYISSVARDISLGKVLIFEGLTTLGAVYQPLHTLFISIYFNILGISELSARVPSVIFGVIGIPFIYLLTKNWTGRNAAIISTFFYTFSQLQIAHATQAKPYTAISTLLLITIYLMQRLYLKKLSTQKFLLLHLGVLIAIILMSLLHIASLLFGLLYLAFIIQKYNSKIFKNNLKYLFFAGIILFLAVSLFFYINSGIALRSISFFNNFVYFREFFFHQYLFFTISSLFGAWFTRNKFKSIGVSIFFWALILIFFWTFIHYSRNIRYILPLFTIMQVFFGIFWATVFEKFFPKKSVLVTFIFISMLFIGWNKVVKKPNIFYSPNADIFADVQNADYKSAFNFIKSNFPDYKEMVVLNDLIDAQKYYLTGKENADAYFMKGITTPQKHGVNGVMVYGNLEDFIKVQTKYPKGLLIVEDWESILPEDIKQYAKKNMKLEYRVENLEVSPTDKWPIEIYSWGMEK